MFKDNINILIIARMHPLYLDDKVCKKYLEFDHKFYEKKILEKYNNQIIFKNPRIEKFGENSNEVFYPVEDLEELKKLYSSASVFLNEYSTTLLEASIFDLPIINVAVGNYRNTRMGIEFYDQHHHLHRLKKYNAITECKNYISLKKEITSILSGEDKVKLNRRKMINEEIQINSGTASKIIIDKIYEILKY